MGEEARAAGVFVSLVLGFARDPKALQMTPMIGAYATRRIAFIHSAIRRPGEEAS